MVRMRATSIVESLVAMVICLIVIGLSISFIMGLLSNGNNQEVTRARALSDSLKFEVNSGGIYEDLYIEINELTATISFEDHEVEALQKFTIEIKNDTDLLAQYDEIIFKP